MGSEQAPHSGATPEICITLAEGMRIQIVPDTETAFFIELAGFGAGESLVFLLTGETEDEAIEMESKPLARVDADSGFRSDKYDLDPYSPISEWRGKVIHSRGVACFDLSLPLPPVPIDVGREF